MVLVYGGGDLNILFTKMLKEFRLSALDLTPLHSPFYGLVPGEPAMLLDHIALPVTFGDRSNFFTEYIRFTVVDFNTAYHAILGRPTLTKYMVVLHYVYLMMKMSGPRGVISVRGDMRVAYDCEREILDMAANLELSAHMDQILTASK